MRHGIKGRKFGRHTDHRKAMLRNLVISLIEHECIQTTLPKAKEARSLVEKIITMGKKNTLHARRTVFSRLGNNKSVVEKVFSVLAEKYSDRNGGYVRVIKTHFRKGDGASMSVAQLV